MSSSTSWEFSETSIIASVCRDNGWKVPPASVSPRAAREPPRHRARHDGDGCVAFLQGGPPYGNFLWNITLATLGGVTFVLRHVRRCHVGALLNRGLVVSHFGSHPEGHHTWYRAQPGRNLLGADSPWSRTQKTLSFTPQAQTRGLTSATQTFSGRFSLMPNKMFDFSLSLLLTLRMLAWIHFLAWEQQEEL